MLAPQLSSAAVVMLFSSPTFLFLFLPVLLGLYFPSPRVVRNPLLLAASLLFYTWGEPELGWLMLLSVGLNYVFGLWAGWTRQRRGAGLVLGLAVAANLALLTYFKYAVFIVENLNLLLACAGQPQLPLPRVNLPIGISFYTFQAMSYVIDVHRGATPAQRNPWDLALYIALFPQLIAGPIVRYVDVAAQLQHRRTTLAGFAAGIQRFVLGLGKKMLIANACASVADPIFDIPDPQLTAAVAWLGIACYSLQIYFDFSGYSDMAIGLGRMFGFEFHENFAHPYAARSITDFWRRWHISLSTWFRDYLYIPLGGNRRGPARTYVNLVVVFLLCGLWHGASWNFVVWGLFHGALLVLERRGLGRALERSPVPLRHAYLLAAVAAGWVFFRADNLHHALCYLRAMAGLGSGTGEEYHLGLYYSGGLALVLAAGVVGSTPWLPLVGGWCSRRAAQARSAWRAAAWEAGLGLARNAALVLVLSASAAMMLASTYNPFIYFRF